ncbi:hypothetical protein M513_09333 [Trichuris suis]|uniref:Reverse transcriptase RNase H-like domain-containing protein n=1 Tax=Trichuris suis TaxID=68888 RepID=A0A085LY20_9BILA|nr:hypothetical protein M513_09333 [Trichuris suis]
MFGNRVRFEDIPPLSFGLIFHNLHRPRLSRWLAAQKMDGRSARWALAIQEYDYVTKYRPGHTNTDADALSRTQDRCTATSAATEISMDTLRREQQWDPILSAVREALLRNIPFTSRLPIPRRLRQVRHRLSIVDGVRCSHVTRRNLFG